MIISLTPDALGSRLPARLRRRAHRYQAGERAGGFSAAGAAAAAVGLGDAAGGGGGRLGGAAAAAGAGGCGGRRGETERVESATVRAAGDCATR